MLALMLARRIALIAAATACLASAAAAAPNACRIKRLETAVHGIRFADPASTKRVVGTRYIWAKIDPMTDFPWVVFTARDGDETLALRSHAGGLEHDFLETEVKLRGLGKGDYLGAETPYYLGRERRDQALPTRSFATPLGIRLGVSKRFVTARLGACRRVFKSRGDMETIRYQVDDERSPLLKSSGMPSYYAEYQFRRGRLVRFRFGFDPV